MLVNCTDILLFCVLCPLYVLRYNIYNSKRRIPAELFSEQKSAESVQAWYILIRFSSQA